MKIHLSSVSPPRTTSSPVPPRYPSATTPTQPETLSFIMAAKAAKASAVGTMSKALATLQTQTLYLVTTDERYHLLDVPSEYMSLSMALGMSYQEYFDVVVDGDFLRPASSLDTTSTASSLGVPSEDPFQKALPPSTVTKLGLKEATVYVSGVPYHFIYRYFSNKTFVIPNLTLAPHEIVRPNDHGPYAMGHGAGGVETPCKYKSGGTTPWDEGPVEDLARSVERLSMTRQGNSSAKKAAPAAWRTQDPSEVFADALVNHGRDLNFDLDDDGVRKGREFRNPLQKMSVAPESSATINMTYLDVPTPIMKLIAVHMAVNFCNYHQVGWTRQEAIAKAMVNIVCYDFGFVRPRGYSAFRKWVEALDLALVSNTSGALASLQDGAATDVNTFVTSGSGVDRSAHDFRL